MSLYAVAFIVSLCSLSLLHATYAYAGSCSGQKRACGVEMKRGAGGCGR